MDRFFMKNLRKGEQKKSEDIANIFTQPSSLLIEIGHPMAKRPQLRFLHPIKWSSIPQAFQERHTYKEAWPKKSKTMCIMGES